MAKCKKCRYFFSASGACDAPAFEQQQGYHWARDVNANECCGHFKKDTRNWLVRLLSNFLDPGCQAH